MGTNPSLLHVKPKTSLTLNSINHNGTLINDQNAITNCLNNYFCSIGESLASSCKTDNKSSFLKYLTNRISSSIFLEPPSINEIINSINSLSNFKAVDHDNIHPMFLKTSSPLIAPYLQIFIDFSFSNGIAPRNCAIAKVIPLHKKGNAEDPNNYRPISILSCFSKIFETILYSRLIKFLDKHRVIQPTQYGFQKSVSTKHAMIDITTNTFDGINHNKYSGLLFLDLQKAFDIVNHRTLLSKLDHYGIRGPANKLIHSLLNRQQFVSINGVNSSLRPISCGVAQGSKLGPLLFLLYINDLPNAINSTPRLFANDTCLLLANSSKLSLLSNMNSELTKLNLWCNNNYLTINPSKSSALIIPPKQENPRIVDPTLHLNNKPIAILNESKYLGIIIDNKLNFKSHIKSIEHKLARVVGIMSKIKYILPRSAKLKLYYSLVHQHLLYGLPVWGSTFPSNQSKLCTYQNKVVKIIGGGKFKDHATPYYHQLNILKLPDLYKHECAKLVYHFFHNTLPVPLANLFTKTGDISSRMTKSTHKYKQTLYLPLYPTTKLQNTLKYQGVKFWNIIPSQIKNLHFGAFKKKLKLHLLTQYNK